MQPQRNDFYNRGTKYLEKNNFAKALQFLKKEPLSFKEKYLNIGNAYRGLGMDKESGEYYLKAADPTIATFSGQRGKYPLALNNLGLLCYRNGDDNAACQFYQEALEVDSGHVDTLWNYSISMLRRGCSGEAIDWDFAWNLYEYRFQRGTKIDRSIPRWFGGPAKVVTVLAEQGSGDKFQFWRYLWCVKEECGGEVLVQCHPEMWSFVKMIGFEPVAEPVGVGIPVCSLAWKYGLDVRGDYVGTWQGGGSGIGVVWSGSKTHANDRNRSCYGGYLKRFSDFDDLIGLNPYDKFGGIHTFECTDWVARAELLRGLKCVVTVDTAIVHLCGVVGTPCIMIQPLKETDFRWGNNGQSVDNIWYDSVSVIENRGWESAIDRAYGMVGELYAG